MQGNRPAREFVILPFQVLDHELLLAGNTILAHLANCII